MEKKHVQAEEAVILKSCTAVIMASIWLAPVEAHADWWWWPFGPRDYEECAENAAREAKSKDALAILLFSCDSKFRGRRKPTGGYTFYDNRQNRHFDIAGPKPTPAELEYIDGQYATYIAAQAERERRWQEELQRERIEAERESEIRQLAAKRQAAIDQIAQAELQKRQQIAQAELQKRQQTALRKIEVTSKSIECTYGPTTCGVYKLTIGIRNQSGETISALSFGWVFMPSRESNCPTSLPTKHRAQMKLAPSETTALNVDGVDGPGSTQFRYCVSVTGAEIVSQR